MTKHKYPIFKKFLIYHSITDHELICEERSVSCIFFYCKCICSVKKLPEHLKIKHKKDISRYSEEVIQTTGPLNSTHYLTHMGAGADCFHSSFYVVDHQFKEKPEPSWCVGPFKQGEKKFFQYMYFHVRKEIAQIWILLYGSRIEAENLKCRYLEFVSIISHLAC